MSSTVSRSRKKTFHGGIKLEHEIKCLYCIIRHILRYGKCLRYAELMSSQFFMTGTYPQVPEL